MKKLHKLVRYEGVILDFDGVISKTSVNNSIEFIYDFINKIKPINREYIINYCKSVMSFPLKDSIFFLIKSLGLENEIENLYREFHKFETNPRSISIEKDFYELVNYFEVKGIDFKILSLASNERLALLKISNTGRIYPLNNKSKANPKTYLELAKSLKINPKKWLYVDDSPIGLRAAKLSNFNTTMMINKIFTMKDYYLFKDIIDFKIKKLISLKKIL
jgi:HAD superfamily hydrolase (TIGR01509 family)